MNFYRYEIQNHATILDGDADFVLPRFPNPSLNLNTYDLIKETPKGYWITDSLKYWMGYKKWISKESKKRYAYPTKEEALKNFILRTTKRIKILKYQIDSCEIALNLAKNTNFDENNETF